LSGVLRTRKVVHDQRHSSVQVQEWGKMIMRTRTLTTGHTRRLRPARWMVSAIAVLAVTGTQATAARAAIANPDRTPPTFAGLLSATTCIPGPIDGQTASYQLSWDPATDDVTPSKQIVYDIYQATKSGGEDFSAATYTVRHGATSFTTPPLPANQQFYFVVRARDRAGNEDSNLVEREGVNLCV
jgi:hypothetical protein